MEVTDKLVGISVLIVCLTWCGIKISESYSKTIKSEQSIEQPKVVESKDEQKIVEGVAPWISDLVNASVTSPDKFKSDGSIWVYNKTEIWVSSGVKYTEIFNNPVIKLTELEKTTLYNAFVNWNKRYSEEAKLNYKID